MENSISRKQFFLRCAGLVAVAATGGLALPGCGKGGGSEQSAGGTAGGATSTPPASGASGAGTVDTAGTAAPAAGTMAADTTAAADPCTDTSGLTQAELTIRTNLKYTGRSPFPDKHCALCQLFVAPASGVACGTCQVVKGPINPKGYCTSFVAKQG